MKIWRLAVAASILHAILGSGNAASAQAGLLGKAAIQTRDCPTTAAAQQAPSGSVTGSDFVQLRRTSCYGSCPSYTVRIDGDGTIHWHGDAFVAVTGDARAQVTPESAAALIDKFRVQYFWQLCGGYSRPITDNPTYLTTISISGQAKTVSDYAAAAPESLRQLDIDVDALADTHHWRHGDPAKETFGASRLEEDLYLPKPGVTDLMRAATKSGQSPGGQSPAFDLQQLITGGGAVNTEDSSGWTALMYAAGVGPVSSVQALLDARADASHRTTAGETVICAALTSYPDAAAKLRLLAKAGVDVSVPDAIGITPLMEAVALNRKDAVATLMDLGADPKLKDNKGRTAMDVLQLSVTEGRIDTTDYKEMKKLLSRVK